MGLGLSTEDSLATSKLRFSLEKYINDFVLFRTDY